MFPTTDLIQLVFADEEDTIYAPNLMKLRLDQYLTLELGRMFREIYFVRLEDEAKYILNYTAPDGRETRLKGLESSWKWLRDKMNSKNCALVFPLREFCHYFNDGFFKEGFRLFGGKSREEQLKDIAFGSAHAGIILKVPVCVEDSRSLFRSSAIFKVLDMTEIKCLYPEAGCTPVFDCYRELRRRSACCVFLNAYTEKQVKLNDVAFSMEINPIVQGDANGDGEVNVADIVEIVNYVLGKPSAKFVFTASDLNGDGEVNVTDIVKVVSIILSADGNAAKERGEEPVELADNDVLTLAKNGDHTLSLNLVNEGHYIASQFDVRLSDGQTLNSITLNSQRAGNHQVAYAEVESGLYRVVVYSLDNCRYDGNDGELLNLSIKGDHVGSVSVENILFITSNHGEKRFDALSGEATGISAIKTEGKLDIYSMDGCMVRKQATTTEGLSKGMYIVNGKKQLVK